VHRGKYNTAARLFFVLFFALLIAESTQHLVHLVQVGPIARFPRVLALWLSAATLTGVLSIRKDTQINRVALVVTLLGVSYIMIYVLRYDDLGPDILVIAAAAVAHRLELLKKRPVLVLTALFGSVFLVRLIGGIQNESLNIFRKTNQTILTVAMGAFLYWIFEEDIVTLRREKQLIQQEIDSIVPFAEFGKNSTGIVHDFKNDAALFSALTSITRQSLGEPIDQNLVSRLEHLTKRLSNRIQLILTATTVHSHSQKDEQFFDLHHTVEASIYPFKASLDFRTVLEVEALSILKGVTMRGRRDLLIAILENLLRNSCEAVLAHASSEVPLVTVRAPSNREIVIQDNGSGFPFCPKGCVHENCLFCPKIRLGVTTKIHGSGLGMHRITQAADMLGIEVIIRSERNHGVTSTIRIPESCTEDT